MRKKNKVGEGEVYTCGQHIRLSANKARRVIDQIRGRSYEEALRILGLMPYRACEPILKLVSSAAANANHNMKIKKTDLIISKAEVNRGTIRKKLKPRARGHSYPIKRTTCHITIVLKDVSTVLKDVSTPSKMDKKILIYLVYLYFKCIDRIGSYFSMIDRDRLKLSWANRESEGVWDKK